MMASGFNYPRNPITNTVPSIGIGEDESQSPVGNSVLIERLSWIAAVFAVVVQQGAIISSPVLGNLAAQIGSPDAQSNVFNTLAVSLSITLLVPLCFLHYRQIAPIIYGNKAAVALFAIIFLSIAWSVYPDVTFRRSINYFSTVLTACFLAGRFNVDEIMRILSWGIAISVLSSFLFVAAFPTDAIHQPSPWEVEEPAGAWRGAFSHKNVLGHAMTVGVIAELYILTATRVRKIWHFLLLCGCVALVILARSSTAFLLTSFYLLGGVLSLLLRRAGQYFGVGLAALAVLGSTVALIYLTYPNLILGLLGSDATLTGRTELWDLVLHLIEERPVLGWGYSALWLPNDPITRAISTAVGWQVPQAHNAFLEVALEIGLVGLAIVMIFVGVSVWRAVRCLQAGRYKLGMVSLVFFLGIIISGTTESTLAQNQTIEWVVFNVLSFCCGLEIAGRKRLSDEVG